MFGRGRGLSLRQFRGKGRSDLSRGSLYPFLQRESRVGQSAQSIFGFPPKGGGQSQPPGGKPPSGSGGSKWLQSFITSRPQQLRKPLGRTDGQTVSLSGTTDDWRSRFKDWKDIGKKYRTVTDSRQTWRDAFKTIKPLPSDELEMIRKHGIEFGEMLGQGGYGSVWLVTMSKNYDDGTPLQVPIQLACKVMNLLTFGPEGTGNISNKKGKVSLSDAVDQLKAEANIHHELMYRNIVRCKHIINFPDMDTGFPYIRVLIFMELCQDDLRHLIFDKPGQRLTSSEALNMFKDVSAGLKYLHDKNICHFDLKTNNVMYVEEDGGRICYKLADFGQSVKFDSGTAQYTHALGTPEYMAPEMNDARQTGKPYNAKATDIYSLGCVLAEAMVGVTDWEEFVQELHNGLHCEAEIFDVYGVPPLCGQLIAQMTRFDPNKRPTIDEVLNHPWLSRIEKRSTLEQIRMFFDKK